MSNIYIEDFLYVIDTIKSIHPLAVFGLCNNFIQYIEKLQERIEDRNSLINALSLATAQLNDGHTNIEIPYSDNDLCLNIPCRWFNNSLYVIQNYKNLQKGDIIESINGVSASEYLKILSNYIPHDNEYLVKARTTLFPYQNYHLFSLLNIDKTLCSNTPLYQIMVNRNGNKVMFCLQAEKYNGCANFIDTVDFIDYMLLNETAGLILNECIFNDVYKNRLDNFFRDVAANNINHIILDLSDNMGGNSMVIQEFLRYLNVDTYNFYDVSIREPWIGYTKLYRKDKVMV